MILQKEFKVGRWYFVTFEWEGGEVLSIAIFHEVSAKPTPGFAEPRPREKQCSQPWFCLIL